MHGSQGVRAEFSVLDRRPAGFLNFGERLVDPQAQRRWTCNSSSEQAALRVLDARTATCAAAVDADI
jgi:hypothetical protein